MGECGSCKTSIPEGAAFCPACGRNVRTGKKGGGGTMVAIVAGAVALVLLVPCLGIAAAILIPNLLSSKMKAQQHQAVSEVRTAATAVQGYLLDHGAPPLPPGAGPEPGWHEVPLKQLQPLLAPAYLQTLPETDPWGQPYRYGYNADEGKFYVLSTGRNCQREEADLPETPVETHCYESDIIFANDAFAKAPGGKQRTCNHPAAEEASDSSSPNARLQRPGGRASCQGKELYPPLASSRAKATTWPSGSRQYPAAWPQSLGATGLSGRAPAQSARA